MIKRLLFLLLLLLTSCGKQPRPVMPSGNPERIISLAPNITETLFALGLGDRLVGVTGYCTYPPEARDISVIGGFGQFNYEAIVTLGPDLVILHREYDAEKTRLRNLGIPCLETGSYTVTDIMAAIEAIGAACGAQPAAEKLVQELNATIEALRHDHPHPPRVLIAFGGSADEDVGQVHAFGTACLHNELLETAGGQNVLAGSQPYQLLSKEAVMHLDPDVIIVLAPELEAPDRERSYWQKLSGVKAVNNDRVYILTDDYTCIPGPRFIQTLEDFSRIIRQNDQEIFMREGQNNSVTE